MKILSRKSFKELYKYAILSLVGYTFVFLFLFFFVEFMEFNKSFSFLIVYGSWYLILYTLQLRFLFNTEHSKQKFFRFCLYLGVFYLIANMLFNLGILLKLNYLIATLITIVILMPLRFIVTKYYVYR